MLELILIGEITVAFVLTLLITPYVNKLLIKKGYISRDVHKNEPTEVPTFGGIAPVVAIFASILIPIVFFDLLNILQLIAILVTISIITLIGIFDDLKTIKQLHKTIFCALASIPLYFVLHDTKLNLPFLASSLDIGVLFLILIVFTVVVSSNLTNMFAGFNGLEASLGVITSVALAVILVITEGVAFLTLLLPFTGALIGFLLYNWYPSRTFPGDTLTLTIGAILACVALVSQLTFYLVILFIPHIIDFFMKATVKFQGRKLYGDTKIRADGTLEPPKYPAVAHMFLKLTPMTEKQLVKTLLIIEIVIAFTAISLALLQYVFS